MRSGLRQPASHQIVGRPFLRPSISPLCSSGLHDLIGAVGLIFPACTITLFENRLTLFRCDEYVLQTDRGVVRFEHCARTCDTREVLEHVLDVLLVVEKEPTGLSHSTHGLATNDSGDYAFLADRRTERRSRTLCQRDRASSFRRDSKRSRFSFVGGTKIALP